MRFKTVIVLLAVLCLSAVPAAWAGMEKPFDFDADCDGPIKGGRAPDQYHAEGNWKGLMSEQKLTHEEMCKQAVRVLRAKDDMPKDFEGTLKLNVRKEDGSILSLVAQVDGDDIFDIQDISGT